MRENPYVPMQAEIIQITQETTSDIDIKTYRLRFVNGAAINFMPGQFVALSLPGVGEAPFGFASCPLEKDTIALTIKRTGMLTEAIHALNVGDYVWIRGPLGNTFPLPPMEGKNLLFIAGGLGLAPLRPLITYVLHETNRGDFGNVNMLIAARSSKDFVYFEEYDQWRNQKDTTVMLTIDKEEPGWQERVGFPHNLVGKMPVNPENTVAVLCGPPIMIKFVSQKLLEMGLPAHSIYTTLEMRMTCGVGKCGKCNIGRCYVCVDGPVFNLAQLGELPNEY